MKAIFTSKIIATVLLGQLLFVSPLLAQSTPVQALLILSKTERTLAIVDPVSLKVIARAPVGPDPHEVIASTDGKYAYVTNYGGGAYNTIAVIDLVEQKALPSIELGALRGPHGLHYTGGKLWFTAEGAKVFGSYDPVKQQVDFVQGTGQNRTHMIFVTDDLKRIVTTNISSGTVSLFEKVMRGPGGPPPGSRPAGAPPSPSPSAPPPPAREDWEQTLITVGKGPEGFDVTPDGKEIWVANSQDGTVSIIDAASKKVSQILEANVRGANRLKFTPDGKRVFISTLSGSDVTVIDTATRREVKRIKLGRGAAGIQMQPDGVRVYVACTPDDYVVVIDLQSLEVIGRIDVGKQPDGMAWANRR
ncbi:MAG: cytochrome D1 domain-containing protein [Blastocatellia bacterium]